MDRHWLASYPSGVAHDIDVTQYHSLTGLLEESFRKNKDRPFSVCMNRWMTYGQVDTLSAALGAYLQSRGLESGARVAIMLPNLPQFAVTMAAILRAGYTCVNVNPLYTARELEHQLRDSGATAIVILENFAHTLADVIDKTQVREVVITGLGDLLGFWYGRWLTFAVRHLAKLVPAYKLPLTGDRVVTPFKQALARGSTLPLRPGGQTLDAIAFLQYTGGTTGLSKGAVLTHRNIVAAILQAEAWFTPALGKIGDVSRTNSIAALPLYHIFALTVCCLLSMRKGGLAVLIPNPRDIPGFIKVLKQYRFHMFPAVNTLYNALLNNPEFKDVDCSNLRVANGGGMAVQEAVAKKWLEVTGCPIIEGYGLSETSPSAICNPTDTDKFSGTVGLPIPGTEIAIRDDEGRDQPIGQPGEICIRGPQVMAGYWKRPDETAKVMYADGFFKTGDVGVMDERGYTKIVDRKKDMILVSGFNVYPNEIEGVVAMCPGVLEVAAVGVPDVHSGEVVKLFVVRRDPTLTEQKLQEFCKDQLTGYKRPKFIEFRNELPKTNVGKILRRELRDEAMKKRA